MIYIQCNHRYGGGNRVAVTVCEKVCGGCPDYDDFCALQDRYIRLFFDERICPACGGTGITEVGYNCAACGASAPWQIVSETELAKKQNKRMLEC